MGVLILISEKTSFSRMIGASIVGYDQMWFVSPFGAIQLSPIAPYAGYHKKH